MRTKRTKLIVTGLLLLGWAGLMAYVSGQPYSDQDLRPLLHTYDLSWVERYFGWVNFTYSSSEISVAYRGNAAFLEFFIRKGAHVTVFAALGFLCMRLLMIGAAKRVMWRAGAVLLIVMLVAGFDEYRHLLNPNRTGLIQDVILDTCGGVVGIVVYLIIYRIRYKRKLVV